jgi:Protein of unknown function (DUF3105)
MSNRQVQRDAQRERRRQERAKARREVRQTRAPGPIAGTELDEPARRSLPWAWIIVGVIVVALIVPGGYWLLKTNNAPLPGQTFASLGNTHINPGDSHPVYNSNPPTSGWHFPTWPQRGIYTAPLPEEYLLHFQEHAGVVVHYNPDKLSKDEVDQLTNIVKSELDKGQGLIVLSPDSSIPDPVAVTSWQHLVTFSTVSGNRSKIEDAIERLQCNYDPEGVCGPQHGVSFQPTGTPAPGAPTVVSGPIPAGVQSGNAMPGATPRAPETPAAGTPTP